MRNTILPGTRAVTFTVIQRMTTNAVKNQPWIPRQSPINDKLIAAKN